jgi:hypothetical protein
MKGLVHFNYDPEGWWVSAVCLLPGCSWRNLVSRNAHRNARTLRELDEKTALSLRQIRQGKPFPAADIETLAANAIHHLHSHGFSSAGIERTRDGIAVAGSAPQEAA